MLEDEELMFDQSAISKLANESVSNIVGEKMFTEKDSKIWMNKIVESVLTSLQTLNKPFKLIKSKKTKNQKNKKIIIHK